VTTQASSQAEVPASEPPPTSPDVAPDAVKVGMVDKSNGVPVLPVVETEEDVAKSQAALPALRRFHLTGALSDPGARGLDQLLPALMAAFREPDKVRHDYPLFLYPIEEGRQELCTPVTELLPALVDEFASGDQARILRDNLPRLERTVRKLARSIYHCMVVHRAGLERRQRVLGRIVDIGAELFAMASVIARARADTRRGNLADKPLVMADLFCRTARRRVKGLFRGLWRNDDRHGYNIAQQVVAGDHAWLEEGVLHGRDAAPAASTEAVSSRP